MLVIWYAAHYLDLKHLEFWICVKNNVAKNAPSLRLIVYSSHGLCSYCKFSIRTENL